MNREVFAAVADALERGEPAALVTIVAARGSTPQRVGAKMLVFADGRIVGTVGVIGPTRMAYERVIPIVDITARLLSNVLSQQG